jgi:uncharacterized protein (TIGR03083 family)
MAEVTEAYRGVRIRVSEIVAAADPAALDRWAPATPEWRVRDILSHMVGVGADVIAGRLDGVATEPWTAAQVDARRDHDVATLLDEWSETGAKFEAMLGDAPFEIAGQALFDAVTHEHDIRNALAAPGARDSDALRLAWQWIVEARGRGGAPALRYITEDSDDVSGTGAVEATIEAPRFELVRAVTGRRTAAEVAAYRWDPEVRVDLVLGAEMFTMREKSLGE